MYSMFASQAGSSLINWFSLGMLIAVPIALLIIGIRGVRKGNAKDIRAGYAMLKLAGLVIAVGLISAVYFIFFEPSGGSTTATTVAEATTAAAKATTKAAEATTTAAKAFIGLTL